MSWDEDAETPLAGCKVLIVENQYLIADDLCAMVERLGGRVLGPASRIRGAMAALQAERPDLALLDVNLEEEMVYPLAATLQKAGIPFLFTTGYDAVVIDPRFRHAPHLSKPIGQGQLAEAVRRMLESPVR